MPKINRTVAGLLKQAGAKLKHSKKHLIYGLPDGKNVVLSSTPSVQNAVKRQIHDVKKHIPAEKEPPKTPREKRVKPGRHGEHRPAPPPPNNLLADQLRTLGIVETALRGQITELEQMVAHLANQRDACWMCRLRKWWNKG